MKSQATRLTRQEAAVWDHWTAKGYIFQPGEKPPSSTRTAPTRAIKHPIRDALLAVAILAIVFGLVAVWIASAARLI